MTNASYLPFGLVKLGLISWLTTSLVTGVDQWFYPRPDAARVASIKDASGVAEAAAAVDAAMAEVWQEKNLQPTGQADDLTLIRRLSLALVGSIPSLQEVRELEAARPSDAVQWYLTKLLKDRRCSDYLAERLVRVYVGTENGPFLIYRRRRLVEWMSDALQSNRPYDQMVRSLIDSKGVWTTSPEANFVTVTNVPRKGFDEAKLAARVSRAFLGMRIDCVQCHDGKLGSTWTQQDFHQLAAYFGQAQLTLVGLRDDPKRTYKHRYLGKGEDEVVPASVPWGTDMLPPAKRGDEREALATWVTAKGNRAFARALVNRFWALTFNRPLSAPVDEIPLAGPYPAGLETLADDFIASGYDLHRLVRAICATKAFHRSSESTDADHPITPESERVWAAFPVTRLRPEQMAGSLVQAASLSTIDYDTNVIFRVKKEVDLANFVKRYGDSGEDTFDDAGGTIPQRLLLMNGNMVSNNTGNNPLINASTRISMLAPNNQAAIESLYLSVLSRRPTEPETAHFEKVLASAKSGRAHVNAMSDTAWTLMNATEFSWNH